VISIRIAIVGLGNIGKAFTKVVTFKKITITKSFDIDLSVRYSLTAKRLEKVARVQNSRLHSQTQESLIALNLSSTATRFYTCTLTL
jgi:homoserine dehydrogenase